MRRHTTILFCLLSSLPPTLQGQTRARTTRLYIDSRVSPQAFDTALTRLVDSSGSGWEGFDVTFFSGTSQLLSAPTTSYVWGSSPPAKAFDPATVPLTRIEQMLPVTRAAAIENARSAYE